MKKIINLAILALGAALLVGCSSGPAPEGDMTPPKGASQASPTSTTPGGGGAPSSTKPASS